MTDRDDDDDMMAAEYVLGTLDPEARAEAARRIAEEHSFAQLVEAWELRLAPLSEAARPNDPSPEVWDAILRRLGAAGRSSLSTAPSAGTVVTLHRSLRRWRLATAGVSALAACLALIVAAGAWREVQRPAPAFIAFLQATDAAPAYVIKADLRDRTLAVRPLAANPPAGRSNELWLIDPQLGAPKSLGILDARTGVHPLPSGLAPEVLARATYAVTEEQEGGSRSGAPTSAPIYLGHLVSSAF